MCPVASLQKTITGPVTRLGAAAQNALEVARFGGLATDEVPSPYEVVSEQRVYRLRHYYADQERGGAADPVGTAADARRRGL